MRLTTGSSSEMSKMNKLVELDAVINEIEEWYEIYPDSDTARKALTMLKRSVKKIPAADGKVAKFGKWTLNKDGSGTCSECGRTQNNCWDLDNWDNYCHFCGADMRFRW